MRALPAARRLPLEARRERAAGGQGAHGHPRPRRGPARMPARPRPRRRAVVRCGIVATGPLPAPAGPAQAVPPGSGPPRAPRAGRHAASRLAPSPQSGPDGRDALDAKRPPGKGPSPMPGSPGRSPAPPFRPWRRNACPPLPAPARHGLARRARPDAPRPAAAARGPAFAAFSRTGVPRRRSRATPCKRRPGGGLRGDASQAPSPAWPPRLPDGGRCLARWRRNGKRPRRRRVRCPE